MLLLVIYCLIDSGKEDQLSDRSQTTMIHFDMYALTQSQLIFFPEWSHDERHFHDGISSVCIDSAGSEERLPTTSPSWPRPVTIKERK